METREQEKLSLLEQMISEKIFLMDKNARYYRKRYKCPYFLAAGVTALITFFSGINAYINSQGLNIFILLLSVIVTFINVILNFNSHNTLWISNTETSNSLKELEIKIKLMKEYNDLSKEDLAKLSKEYRDIISIYNKNWSQARKSNLKKV
ncbi:MAG: DUF4231 domain-containing protein [Marinifilaceae bacterium]|jgi:hypothetical protein|nr:DUF4231 domain-containing protein [Marinifilaceae bacterium]